PGTTGAPVASNATGAPSAPPCTTPEGREESKDRVLLGAEVLKGPVLANATPAAAPAARPVRAECPDVPAIPCAEPREKVGGPRRGGVRPASAHAPGAAGRSEGAAAFVRFRPRVIDAGESPKAPGAGRR